MSTFTVFIVKPTAMEGILIIDIAKGDSKKIENHILKKFFTTSYELIFFSEIATSTLDNNLSADLKKYKSKLNKNFYQIDLQKAVELVANIYNKNYFCSNSNANNIVKEIISKKEHQKFREIEYDRQLKEFAINHQHQYDDLNKIWDDHWVEKSKILNKFMHDNKFPVFRRGIFINQQKARDEFNKASYSYSTKLRKLIEDWRDSTKSLPSHLEVNCPKCSTKFKMSLHGFGPGNMRTYGGNSWNTDTSRPLTKEYGVKLLEGKKYWLRSFYALKGKCTNINCNFLEDIVSYKPPFKNVNNFSIYLYHDKESWFEYIGVWGTMSKWLAFRFEYHDYDSFYHLFEKYFDNN
jgi:hypothetical protein